MHERGNRVFLQLAAIIALGTVVARAFVSKGTAVPVLPEVGMSVSSILPPYRMDGLEWLVEMMPAVMHQYLADCRRLLSSRSEIEARCYPIVFQCDRSRKVPACLSS